VSIRGRILSGICHVVLATTVVLPVCLLAAEGQYIGPCRFLLIANLIDAKDYIPAMLRFQTRNEKGRASFENTGSVRTSDATYLLSVLGTWNVCVPPDRRPHTINMEGFLLQGL
jgi:hypothetical protein